MGVIDDIKEKMGGGHENSSSFDSGLDDSLGSSMDSESGIGSDNALNSNPPGPQNSPNDDTPLGQKDQRMSNPGQNNSQNPPQDLNQGQSPKGHRNQQPPQSGRQTNNLHNQGQNTSQNNRRGNNGAQGSNRQTPNPQSGRPEPGSNSPQLSNNTKKKMQNAGMDPANPQAVSDQQSELEEIKRQNEQIIDLLKRLNQTLNSI
ncbi:hypothetical protein [Candidatus Nanohalobium constans]|nr:hypothetical protein [Candidatus Nanohalobium constans]